MRLVVKIQNCILDGLEESVFALFWAAINLFYLLAALVGWMRWRLGIAGMALVGFVLLRSAFLGTLENPEPRYVLECFPVLLVLAGGAFARKPFGQRETPASFPPA